MLTCLEEVWGPKDVSRTAERPGDIRVAIRRQKNMETSERL